MATISMSQLKKIYPNGFEAVHGIDLDISEGEFVVLVGPSGCGKTTVLRMVAGLEEISGGFLQIDGRPVNDVSPEDRDIAMVFQNYALYPHMTVAENIGFSLKLRRLPKPEIRQRVERAAQVLGLTEWLERKPGQLSGGQRQRVAMGRAIVREPSAFLMDEPLSNLDANLRVQMRAEVAQIQQSLGVATLYVTHDQVEAMTMGSRVAVMRAGSVEQVAPPQELYDRPLNLFVAGFIGSPSINLFEAQVGPGGDELALGTQSVALAPDALTRHPPLSAYAGRRVIVGLRPEHLPLGAPGDDAVIQADVDLVEALGSEQLVHFSIDARRITTQSPTGEEQLVKRGAGVSRIDPRLPLRPGSRVALAVDLERAHFFDPDTEQAI